MVLNYSDPALSSEIEGFDLGQLSMQELHEQAARKFNKPLSQVDATDIADFMVGSGATHEQLLQIFSEKTVNAIADKGFVDAPYGLAKTPTVYDPAVSGEIDIPPFAQRFVESAGVGMQRHYDIERVIGLQGAIEREEPIPDFVGDSLRRSKPAFPHGYVPPVTVEDPPEDLDNLHPMDRFLRGIHSAATDIVTPLADALKPEVQEEMNNAPPVFPNLPGFTEGSPQDRKAAEASQKYLVDDWLFPELQKIFSRGENMNALSVLPLMMGTAGRVKDMWAGASQTALGRFSAFLMKNNIFQDQWKISGDDFDPADLDEIIAGETVGARKRARKLFQDQTNDLFPGTKAVLEGNVFLWAEIVATPALKLPGFVSRSFSRFGSRLVRPLQPLVEAVDRKVLANINTKAFWWAAEERVKIFDQELGPTFAAFFKAAGATSAKATLQVLRDIFNLKMKPDDWAKMMQEKYYARDPALLGDRVQDVLAIIRGHAKKHPLMAKGDQYTRIMMGRFGVKSPASVLKEYASDERPPLPLDIPWTAYGDDAVLPEGMEWSQAIILEQVKNRIAVEYAHSIGYDGPRLIIPGLRQGNVWLPRWFAMQIKSQLGYLWLMSRPGFAVLNLISGSAMIAQKHNLGADFLTYRQASQWRDALVKEGISIEALLGKRAIQEAQAELARFATGGQQEILGIGGATTLKVGRGDILPPLLQFVPGLGEKIIPGVTFPKIKIPRFGIDYDINQHNLGIVGRNKQWVTMTEGGQHRLVQTLALWKHSHRIWADRVETLNIPDAAKKKLIDAWRQSDSGVFSDNGMRVAWGNIISSIAEGRKIHTLPVEAIGFYDDDGINAVVRKALMPLGPEASPTDIRIAMLKARDEIIENGQQQIDAYFESNPEAVGAAFHLALKAFRQTGTIPDATTYEVLTKMVYHDQHTTRLMSELMDAFYPLITKDLDEAHSALVRTLLDEAQEAFRAVQTRRAKRSAEITGKYVGNKRKKVAGAGEQWRAEYTAMMQEFAAEYIDVTQMFIYRVREEVLASAFKVRDEARASLRAAQAAAIRQRVMRSRMVRVKHSKALEIPGGMKGGEPANKKIRKEVNDEIERQLAKWDQQQGRTLGGGKSDTEKFVDAVGGAATIVEGGASDIRSTDGAFEMLRRLISNANKELAGARDMASKMVPEDRAPFLEQAHLRRREKTEAAYRQIARRLGVTLPDSRPKISERLYHDTVRLMDQAYDDTALYDEIVRDNVAYAIKKNAAEAAGKVEADIPYLIQRFGVPDVFDITTQGTYKGMTVVEGGLPGTRGDAAVARVINGVMHVDTAELKRKFISRAWTKPRKLLDGSRADPLRADMFSRTRKQVPFGGVRPGELQPRDDQFDLFKAFVVEAARLRTTVKRLPGETDGMYANRINRMAFQQADPQTVRRMVAGDEVTADALIAIRNETLTLAREISENKSADILFAYTYNRPETMINAVFPYAYWTMKYFVFQMRHMIENPGHFTALMRVVSQFYRDTQHLPPHLQGTVKIPLYFEDGTELRMDPKTFFAGGFGDIGLEILHPGSDKEFQINLASGLAVLRSYGLQSMYPHWSLIGQGMKHLYGEENAQRDLPPELYDTLYNDFNGIFQELDSILNSASGSMGNITKSLAGTGMLGPKLQELVRDRGLAQHNYVGIGRQLSVMLRDREITQPEAREALLSLHADQPNELATEAMSRYFETRGLTQGVNWFSGGVRHVDEADTEARKITQQWVSLRDRGMTDEADALIQERSPWVPFRWKTNDKREDMRLTVNRSSYFYEREELRKTYMVRSNNTDAFEGLEKREQLEQAFEDDVLALQEKLGLSDDDIYKSEKDKVFVEPSGEPFFPGNRNDYARDMVRAYFSMVDVEDFKVEKEIGGRKVTVLEQDGLEKYLMYRQQWVESHVPPSMQADFDEALTRNISIPDAILRVFGDIFAKRFFEVTENLDAAAKEEWLMVNGMPSEVAIAREVVKAFPDRWTTTEVMNKIDSTLSIRGYFDVSEARKVRRVKNGTVDSVTFSSGYVLTKERIPEWSRAKADFVRYMQTKPARDAINLRIRRLTDEYKGKMSELLPMDFAKNKDDAIREEYYGSSRNGDEPGYGGKIGLEQAHRDLEIDTGKIGKWTPGCALVYGISNDEIEEAMLMMRSIYYSVDKSTFANDDGVDWNAFNRARDAAYQQALVFGKEYKITEDQFREQIFRNVSAGEAAWRFWQEKIISPLMEKRGEIKAQNNGLITRVQHDAIASLSAPTTVVGDVVSEIIKRFPHLTADDFDFYLRHTELPSFSQYWGALGYSPPKRGGRAIVRDNSGTARSTNVPSLISRGG